MGTLKTNWNIQPNISHADFFYSDSISKRNTSRTFARRDQKKGVSIANEENMRIIFIKFTIKHVQIFLRSVLRFLGFDYMRKIARQRQLFPVLKLMIIFFAL